jgi:hypothetical protein
MICNYFYIIKKFGAQTIVIKKKEKHSQKTAEILLYETKLLLDLR